MKSNKQHRASLPPRGHSSRGAENENNQPLLAGQQVAPSRATMEKESVEIPSGSRSDHGRRPTELSATAAGVGNDERTAVEELKIKMAEALAQKQPQQASALGAAELVTRSPQSSAGIAQRRLAEGTTSSNESLVGTALSTESAKTVKGNPDKTPGTIKTPSYPFPRMALRLDRGSSHRSAPSHKPFTLLSPTNAPAQANDSIPTTADDPPSSEISTPAPERAYEDPNFPTPDLYDMILMLSTEPGIEAWWANVTQILAEAYGAERASLAVPGDMTDLENVPWGQKATFNIHGTDSFGSSTRDSATMSESEIGLLGRRVEDFQSPVESTKMLTRPVLETRHSIAGVRPDTGSKGARRRPQGPVRAFSNISGHEFDSRSRSVSPKIPKQPLKTQPSFASEAPPSELRRLMNSSESATSVLRAVVHRTLQALEVEADPLMVRTGVSAMFGKRKPIILTRAYVDDVTSDMNSLSHTVKEKGKDTASIDRRSSMSTQTSKSALSYEDYEQPEPSPWSQSPAPSPAARPDPTESPFFAQPASIDETAFEQNPPPYDYAATANQSLAAIGTDTSKTLIHVPLIQPVPSRGILSSNLRFPIAILSFLSPINPYPRNLRHSLTHLLPHLASSCSLAQQYTTLLDRARGPVQGRPSLSLGLGGTFSDENSELELVVELSGQVAQGTGRESRSSFHGSIHSASERYSTIQEGTTLSAPVTPYYEQFGMSPGLPPTPGRSGAEALDSYFSAKRPKGGSSQQPTTPGGLSVSEESPESMRSSKQKTLSNSRGPPKKVTISSRRQKEPSTPSASLRPGGTGANEPGDTSHAHGAEKQEHGWPRQLSTQRNHAVKDHSERPLPELISTLMLNSVPLQLFLAKPRTGELVWTNSKFDAFRTQGDSRARDPWQNVHASDLEGLSKGWNHTLKTGNQFTQHVRVKRFSGDNDYRWFIFRANPLLSQNGQLLYWIGSFLDVHDKHMAELRAADEKETFVRDAKYRALANSIPQILFEAIELEGIVSANEQWHIFSGQSLDDALNLGFAKHVHREDLQKCGLISLDEFKKMPMQPASSDSNTGSSESSNRTAHPAELSATGYSKVRNASTPASLENLVKEGVIKVEQDENGRVSYTTELRLRSKGGEFRWFLVRLVKVESDLISLGRASWYGTCTDINDRKALERELNRVNKKMYQEMESKTKFFANMSHEIRTPLNGILGSIPWLVESSLDHDQRRTLDTIQNSSNNLRELVDNILDVTKVEAGKMSLVFKYFHVRTLLEEIIDTVASRAIDKGLELNYTVDLNVPTHVKGDPFRLRQVLINLMGNAVKFTDQGEVYTRCSLREQPAPLDGDPNMFFLAFDVIDTGRGFDQVGFQRLFKQFGQIDGSSSHDAGSGLGLFLSKQLVEMHGGQLSATSEVDQGATFIFYIRVEMASQEDEIKSPPPARSTKKRSSISDSGSPRSRSDSKTPTLSVTRGGVQSPGLPKFVSSPEVQSPALTSSGSSDPSIRSVSGNQTERSSFSSFLPTSESSILGQAASAASERQILLEQAMYSTPMIKRSRSENESSAISSEKKHPTTYSVVVICPAQYARAAIKQHIEQVVPHEIVVNVTTIEHMGAFLELMQGPASPIFTHIILDLPASADVMLFMRQMCNFTGPIIPTLVVITDHYQKRDILEDYTTLTNTGRRAFLVHKPVKPSVFALIFDPAQLRNLSKDRTRDLAQSVTENFKNVSERVKRAIGGKAYRVLLVEDSDVNRMVSSPLALARESFD
jgi:signal transduction histidine kinase